MRQGARLSEAQHDAHAVCERRLRPGALRCAGHIESVRHHAARAQTRHARPHGARSAARLAQVLTSSYGRVHTRRRDAALAQAGPTQLQAPLPCAFASARARRAGGRAPRRDAALSAPLSLRFLLRGGR